MHYLHENDLFHSDWIKTVHNTLNTLELSDIWLSHDTFYSQAAFTNKVKTRISDQFKQEWKNNIDESEKCLSFRLYKKKEFCFGELVYKLKKIVGSNNFSAQFIKIISHYKKIGYNINVLQQTACLVVNPITVGNFAFLFNCTRMGRTSDSMRVLT